MDASHQHLRERLYRHIGNRIGVIYFNDCTARDAHSDIRSSHADSTSIYIWPLVQIPENVLAQI